MDKIREKIQRCTKEDLIRFLAIYAVVVFLILFLVCPLCTLFLKAFQDKDGTFVGMEQFSKYFSSRAMLYSISNTFFVAIMSTLISVTLAFLFAYSLSRKNVPFKGFFRYVGMIPIFAPTMLLGIALIYLFGNQGIFTRMGLEYPCMEKWELSYYFLLFCLLLWTVSSTRNRIQQSVQNRYHIR